MSSLFLSFLFFQPLQARETASTPLELVSSIGFVPRTGENGAEIARVVNAMEAGRRLARDVGGPDCERMTPHRCVDYIVQAFHGEPTVKDWARWADTIEHEIVTGLGSRLRRTVRNVALRSVR